MDWKDKLNTLLPDNYKSESKDDQSVDSKISLSKQTLRIELDKRNGKAATLITGFEGTEEALKELARIIKTKCASGGSQRDGEILIQGDFRPKIAEILQQLGYSVKKINFK
ncbi:MAG: translation initiation factor [Paludibacteraceae bacterium]